MWFAKGRAGLWFWAKVALRERRLASLPSMLLSSAMMKVSVTARDSGNVMLEE